jgi:hypothetical protein
MSKIKVIIPAYNEEKPLHTLLKKFPSVRKLLLSTTQLIILLKWQEAGATVLSENRKGMAMLA